MHPYVYCDLQQSAKAIPKLLLIVAALGLLLRFFGGPLGLILTYLILVPNLVVSLGAGSLSEELHKGPIRFLYGLPVRRFDLWLIKACFGILFSCLVVILISAILLAFRLDTALEWLQIAKSFEIDLKTVLLFSVALLTYNFASGLFAATATSNNRTLGFVNVIFVYLPFVAFWFAYDLVEIALDADDLTFLFFASSIPLFVGSIWLFVRRNPFHEKPWQRRLQALCFFIVTLGVMAVTTLTGSDTQPPRVGQVTSFTVSPQQDRIVVASQERMIHTRGLLFDAEGTLLQDFGRNFALPFTSLANQGDPLIWRPERPQILTRNFSTDLFEEDLPLVNPFTLIDLETGIRRDLPYRKPSDENEFIEYLGWTPSGESLVGTRGIESQYFIFLQDAETGRMTDLEGAFEWGPSLYENFVIGTVPTPPNETAPEEETVDPVGDEEQPTTSGELALRILDLSTVTSTLRPLSPNVSSWTVSSDARWLIKGERRINQERVEDVILIEDLQSGDVRTLRGAPLPSASLIEAAQGTIGSLSVDSLNNPDWSQVSTVTADGLSGTMALLSHQTGELVPLPVTEESTGQILPNIFQHGERSRVVYLGHTFTEERQTVQLQVFELETVAETTEIKSLLNLEYSGIASKAAWLGPNRLLLIQTLLPDDPNAFMDANPALWIIDLESGDMQPFTMNEPPAAPN